MLLAAAVAASAALIVTVACAVRSIHVAIDRHVGETVGAGDLQVRAADGAGAIPESIIERVAAWPEVAAAAGRLVEPVSVAFDLEYWEADGPAAYRRAVRGLAATATGNGIDPAREPALRPLPLVRGRMPAGPGEVVIDELLAGLLSYSWTVGDKPPAGLLGIAGGSGFIAGDAGPARSDPEGEWLAPGGPGPPPRTADEARAANEAARVRVGDTVRLVRRFRDDVPVVVVGIVEQPPLGGRAQVYFDRRFLAEFAGREGGVTEVVATLRQGFDPASAAANHAGDLGPGVLVLTSAKVTAGLDQNMKSSELGLVLLVVLASMLAGFIILTGLTTNVTERERELAIIRCVGGTRGQVGAAQLFVGVATGLAGGLVGVPLGVGISWLLTVIFRDELPTGLTVPPGGLVLAGAGSVLAGALGGAWPAWRASRVNPLTALATRAVPASPRGLRTTLAAGLACLAVQALIVTASPDGQVMFWAYATTGLPVMVLGYFLLGVPAVLAASRAVSGVLSRALGLPAALVSRTVAATPYRHGFTAGTMMGGLALLIAIWTNGGAVLRDWLGKVEFPDAFVSGLALTADNQAELDKLPFVEGTCAITLYPVEVDAFGVRALQRYRTSFIAFEPDRFFAMTRLTWVQGDEASARRRLAEGGAVIVSREYLTARGLGVGDEFVCRDRDSEHRFEIVGVVTSPGLEIVSRFFNIGEEFHQQAVHAVFGTREDLLDRFGQSAIHLIQIDLSDDADDDTAVAEIRRVLFGAGVLDAGSGRRVKREISRFATGSLLAFSGVAVAAMLVASFGVANLIVAGVEGRRFEFGVLRAVGASRGMLTRLVIAEALVVALAAGVLGTAMGLQGSWAGQRLNAGLLGLDLELRPPWGVIALSWAVVVAITLVAAAPAIIRLGRHRPREWWGAVGAGRGAPPLAAGRALNQPPPVRGQFGQTRGHRRPLMHRRRQPRRAAAPDDQPTPRRRQRRGHRRPRSRGRRVHRHRHAQAARRDAEPVGRQRDGGERGRGAEVFGPHPGVTQRQRGDQRRQHVRVVRSRRRHRRRRGLRHGFQPRSEVGKQGAQGLHGAVLDEDARGVVPPQFADAGQCGSDKAVAQVGHAGACEESAVEEGRGAGGIVVAQGLDESVRGRIIDGAQVRRRRQRQRFRLVGVDPPATDEPQRRGHGDAPMATGGQVGRDLPVVDPPLDRRLADAQRVGEPAGRQRLLGSAGHGVGRIPETQGPARRLRHVRPGLITRAAAPCR